MRVRSISAAQVVKEVETEDPEQNRFWFRSWGRYATEEDLAAVFEAMVAQSNAGRLCKYLRVFGARAMSSLPPALLRYADHEEPAVRELGFQALSNYTHPEVRRLAIERLQAGRVVENELELLKRNYRPGDAVVIEQALQIPEDADQAHRLVFDLAAVVASNPLAELAGAMLFIYEQSPCSNCRLSAVKALVEQRVAPGWLIDECRHDSSQAIRAHVQRHDTT